MKGYGDVIYGSNEVMFSFKKNKDGRFKVCALRLSEPPTGV